VCVGVGVAVVMLVCVGFIVSLIILGVMRVRNAKRCGGGGDVSDEKQELDWDNSALTVTVNPMHPDVSAREHCVKGTVRRRRRFHIDQHPHGCV